MGVEEQAGDADAWKEAVSMLTGYVLPERATLFTELLGNAEIPLMKVELSGVVESEWPPNTGWGVDNTGYVIAFRIEDGNGIGRAAARISLLGTYNPQGGGPAYIADRPIEGGKFRSGLKKPHALLGKEAKTEWDNSKLHQYVYGSGLALRRLLDAVEGTKDFSWGGLGVQATDQVNFTTFDVAGASFDRVATFFHHSADHLQNWEESLGTEDAAWLGQSAGVFRDLVHQLNRNYAKFAQGLRVTSGGSMQARNLERARNVLREAVSDLWAAWNVWHATKGHPLFHLKQLLDEIRTHVEINNIPAVGRTPAELGGMGRQADTSDEYAYSFFSTDAQVIGRGLNFGKLNDIYTWKKVGDHAVQMWTESVRNDLESPARAAMSAIHNVWNNMTPPPVLNMSKLNLEQDYLMDKQMRQERETEANQKKADRMNREAEEKNDRFMKDQEAKAKEAEESRNREIEENKTEQEKLREEQKKEQEAQLKEQRAYEAKVQAEQKAMAADMERDRKQEATEEKKRIETQREQEEAKAQEREKRAETLFVAQQAEEDALREEERKRGEEAQRENEKREAAYNASRIAQEKQNEEDRKKAEQRYAAEQLREQQSIKQNEEDRKKAEQRYEQERKRVEEEQKKAETQREKEARRIEEEVKKNEQQQKEEIKKNQQLQAEDRENAARLNEESRAEEQRRYEEGKAREDQRYRETMERQKQEADRATKEFERARLDTGSAGLGPIGVDDSVSVSGDGSLITDHPDGTSTVYDPETRTVTTVYPDGSTSVEPVPSSQTGTSGWGSSGYEQELYDPYTDPVAGSSQTLVNNSAQNSPYGSGTGGFPPGMMGGAGGGADSASGERTRSVMGTGITVRSTARQGQQSPYGDELTAPARGNTTGSSMPPMMPPMGGQQPSQDGGSSDRERTSWVAEDEDVWGTDEGGAPAVIGR
ncbi:AAWKG family protein [Streptomyces zaomyceticus]|uniref:AAWKG family protein n=1 Tax=Streptomyces zaomyceticus TaxID=68286 RepID=UPI00368BC3C7